MKRAKLTKSAASQRVFLTPSNGGVAIKEALAHFDAMTQEQRWEEIYQSSSDTITATIGSSEITGISTVLTERLGDVWIAVGTSGFTPSKFYKLESIKDDTSAILEHEWQEATVTNGEYYLFRPKRLSLVLESGNYDASSIPGSWNFSNPLCLSVTGVTTDAQIFWDSSQIIQGLFNYGITCGEISFSKLRLTQVTQGMQNSFAQSIIRLSAGGDGGIVNSLVERCLITSEFVDWGVFANVGTVMIRNNISNSSFEGAGHAFTFDKFYCYGNVHRSSAPLVAGGGWLSGHYKAGASVLVGLKGSGNPAREAWVHNNHLTVINNGGSLATFGIYFKNHDGLEGTAFANSKYVSSNNIINVEGDTTEIEGHQQGFIAGINVDSGGKLTPPTDLAFPAESHGDIITLNGSATRQYGYRSEESTLDIWRRPDLLSTRKAGSPAGLINEDGVPI